MIAREMLCRPFSRSDGLVTESRKVEVYRVEKTSMMLKRLIVCVCVCVYKQEGTTMKDINIA